MRVQAQQNDTLDLICWRHFGITGGITEQVLAANQNLADVGCILPHGTWVTLPDAMPATPASSQQIQLWD
jgi:phage tail protein X